MRILLIIPDLRRGGAERVFVTLARGLSARGHDVSVLLFYREIEFRIPVEVALHFLTGPSRHMRFGWLDKRLLAWGLKRWLLSVAPFDLIVSNLSFASEVVHLAGIEDAWHHVHGTLSAELDELRPDHKRKARRRLRRFRRIFDGKNLIAVSDGVAVDLYARIGLSRSNIVTIYNPHDLDEIRTLVAMTDPAIPSRPYVVHAGRFVKGKRHDILLDAFAASGIPHDLVLLANESPALRRLIESRSLSSRVSVVGVQENPFPWYAGASALILSSDHEGLPNVLIEALASGTPVISTDCPSGPLEILRGQLQRYLSPVGNISAMAGNLRSVVEAPPDIDPALLNKFSMTHTLDKFEELGAPHNPSENLIYQDDDGDWVQHQQGLIFFTRNNSKVSANKKKLDVSNRWYYYFDVTEGDTIVDLGVGGGDETIFMSQSVGPNGRVIAVEANPATYRCLMKTVEANGLRNVTTVNVAISDRVGETIVEENEENNLANRIGVEHGVKVPCTTLDKLLASLGIQDVALVKVNVEGAETGVLCGSRKTLASARNWVISCHDFISHLPGYEGSATYSDVKKLLTQAGLRILPRRSDSRLPVPFFVYARRE
jgi:FkbM family methyltransferase